MKFGIKRITVGSELFFVLFQYYRDALRIQLIYFSTVCTIYHFYNSYS